MPPSVAATAAASRLLKAKMIEQAIARVPDLFHHTKFINSKHDMKFGGYFCQKMSEKLMITDDDKWTWWQTVRKPVRSALNNKRNTDCHAVKEEMMSKLFKMGQHVLS